MQRILLPSMAFIFFIIISLCGCNSTSNPIQNSDSLSEMRIGIDANYEPYTYIDDDGSYAGLDVDLATAACEIMNVTPVFVPIKWDNKNTLLTEGSIDCVWSCFSMTGRDDEYDWVGPYMYSRIMVVVRDDSQIKTLSDLEGGSVAVISSTKPEEILLSSNADNRNGDIPVVNDIYCMENMNLVFSALSYGYVDAAASHETTINSYMSKAAGTYRLLDEPLQSVEIGIAFGKNTNSDLRLSLDEAISELKKDGTLKMILESYGVDADVLEGGVD